MHLCTGGISFEDARDYTQIGCIETVIPGKSNPHAVTGEVNFLKALEYALEDGKSIMNPQLTPGTKTGNPDKFNTFEKLEAAVNVRLLHIVDVCCGEIVNATEHMVSVEPKPYKSLLFGGIPNLADRLRMRHFMQ